MEIKPFAAVQNIKHVTSAAVPAAAPTEIPPAVTQTAEAPTSEVKAEEPKEDSLQNERFAALTKKERAIRKRELLLQDREKGIARWEEAEKLAGQNKLEAVKRLGISYDDLTNLHLAQMGEETAEKKPQEIAAQTAKEIAQAEVQAFKEQMREQQVQMGLVAVRNEAVQLTQQRPEEFEYINAYEAHDMIVDIVADSNLNENSPYEKPLSTLEAMKEVEDFLERQAEKAAALKKFRSKHLPPSVEAQKSSGQPPEPNQKPQTLTHRATTAPVKPRGFTAAELKERAIKRFYGQQID